MSSTSWSRLSSRRPTARERCSSWRRTTSPPRRDERLPVALVRGRSPADEPHAEDERGSRLRRPSEARSTMRLDIAWVPDPENDDDLALAAERAGYDAVLLPEISHDPFLPL